MEQEQWKVGQLSRLTGVSVRTLHHYHEIGLLVPSGRNEAGYRLYNRDDVVRLGQVKLLQNLGFRLEEIGACLTRPDFSPHDVVRMHLARLKEQMARQQKLCARLEAVEAHLSAHQTASAAEFMEIIEGITQVEKYYTPEQLQYLQQRRETVGEERIREVEAEWPRLQEEVRAAMERGEDPMSETAQQLAKRWRSLVEEFTGGDPGIGDSLNQMYQQESNVHGMDIEAIRPMMEWIQRAQEASQS